jgi:hypothetical protein
MHQLSTTTLTFPEIKLQTRDAHKLRGYFGNLFREHSPLLHNHLEDGTHLQRYPLVQYKVVNEVPTLVGFNEGASLLTSLFLKVKELDIEGKIYPVLSKNIQHKKWDIGVDSDLHQYRYETLWMALNQENHKLYTKATEQEKKDKLKAIAISNILAFYKAFACFVPREQRILLNLTAEENQTMFKDQKMLAFSGGFTTNALLPDLAGLGKSVARGFGTIQKI